MVVIEFADLMHTVGKVETKVACLATMSRAGIHRFLPQRPSADVITGSSSEHTFYLVAVTA